MDSFEKYVSGDWHFYRKNYGHLNWLHNKFNKHLISDDFDLLQHMQSIQSVAMQGV